MPSPSAVLPDEARRAAWEALWKRLLSEPVQDPESAEPDDHDEGDEEAF